MRAHEDGDCRCPVCGRWHHHLDAPVAVTLAALARGISELNDRLARLEGAQRVVAPAMNGGRRLIGKKELRQLVLLSHAHIARLENAGKFPKRVKLGGHRSSRAGWYVDEIEAWVSAGGRIPLPL